MEHKMKYIEKIFNVETNEETLVERDLTKQEIDFLNYIEEQNKKIEEEEKNKSKAKANLLKKLGITAEEADLLLS